MGAGEQIAPAVAVDVTGGCQESPELVTGGGTADPVAAGAQRRKVDRRVAALAEDHPGTARVDPRAVVVVDGADPDVRLAVTVDVSGRGDRQEQVVGRGTVDAESLRAEAGQVDGGVGGLAEHHP